MGVDYDLFWKLNPKSLKPFVKAFELKQKYDDEMNWMQGLYIRHAIASAMNKKAEYPKQPIGYNVSKKTKPINNGNEIREKFLTQMKVINNRFKK